MGKKVKGLLTILCILIGLFTICFHSDQVSADTSNVVNVSFMVIDGDNDTVLNDVFFHSYSRDINVSDVNVSIYSGSLLIAGNETDINGTAYFANLTAGDYLWNASNGSVEVQHGGFTIGPNVQGLGQIYDIDMDSYFDDFFIFSYNETEVEVNGTEVKIYDYKGDLYSQGITVNGSYICFSLYEGFYSYYLYSGASLLNNGTFYSYGNGEELASIWFDEINYTLMDINDNGENDSIQINYDVDINLSVNKSVTVQVQVFNSDQNIVDLMIDIYEVNGTGHENHSIMFFANESDYYSFNFTVYDAFGIRYDSYNVTDIFLDNSSVIFSEAWINSSTSNAIDTNSDSNDDALNINYDVNTNLSSETVNVTLQVYNSLSALIEEQYDEFTVVGNLTDIRQMQFNATYDNNYTFVILLFGYDDTFRDSVHYSNITLSGGEGDLQMQVSAKIIDEDGDL
ncbi:MAG: hypothetical protein JSW28_07420, partial [Thermoplasmata archaeon]